MILGTCSLCRGPVEVPNTWYGVQPPTPKCRKCGAVPQEPYGPIIPMAQPFATQPQPDTSAPSIPYWMLLPKSYI